MSPVLLLLLAVPAALAPATAAPADGAPEDGPASSLEARISEAAPGDSAGFLTPPAFFRFDLFVGSTLDSHTRVGEHADYGTTLRLKDIGVRWEEQVHFTFGRWYGPDDLVTCSIVDTILRGSATLPSDVHYNGATLQGGTDLASHPLFLTIEARYERILARWGEDRRGSLGLDLGIRCDRLHWYFSGTLAPGSTGHEQGEGFDKQATPIPVIGLDLREPLARRLDLVAGLRGFRANAWPTFRTEGGAVSWSETYVEARAGVEWTLSRSAALSVQARYELIDIWEDSREDRNGITLRTLGLMIGLRLDF